MERPPLSLDVNRRPKGAANAIKRRESVNTLQQKSVRESLRRVYDEAGNVIETHGHEAISKSRERANKEPPRGEA